MGAFSHLLTDANLDGHWSPVTASIDWCEINYAVSFYIAEFINTLTNVPGMLGGLYGAYATYNSGVPLRYALIYLGHALISIGSFGFHASLRWEWQLMDELPMIYVVSYASYLVVDTLPGFEHRFGIAGPLAVVAWCIFVSVSYVCLPNPVYHQVAFACIMLFSIVRAVWLSYQIPRERRTKICRTLLLGVGVFVMGFAVWNLDNFFCTHIREVRDWLTDHGLHHLGHLTQGHGYWHLMTSYGALLIFTACVELCLSVKTNPYAYDYDASAWLPLVRPVKSKVKDEDYGNGTASSKVNGNGHINGAANGH